MTEAGEMLAEAEGILFPDRRQGTVEVVAMPQRLRLGMTNENQRAHERAPPTGLSNTGASSIRPL